MTATEERFVVRLAVNYKTAKGYYQDRSFTDWLAARQYYDTNVNSCYMQEIDCLGRSNICARKIAENPFPYRSSLYWDWESHHGYINACV